MGSWIENELIELINSDQFRLSIPIQFQFNSNSKSFNSIPIQFMLNWIELIINSNSIHELIRALIGTSLSLQKDSSSTGSEVLTRRVGVKYFSKYLSQVQVLFHICKYKYKFKYSEYLEDIKYIKYFFNQVRVKYKYFGNKQ